MTLSEAVRDLPRITHVEHGLEVIALSETEWRISDPTRPQRDAISLLGFVQKVGDRFELTALGAPRVRTYFGSLSDAVAALQQAQRAA